MLKSLAPVQVLVRTDSSTRIGTGHMMRCLTLANQLRDKGCEVTFVTRRHPGNLNDQVIAAGFELLELPAPLDAVGPIPDADYQSWLGVSQDQDAKETLAAVEGRSFEWLIVDHYSLDAKWETQLRGRAAKVMVIDDLANRPHDCDLLLDQNFYLEAEKRYENLIPPTASRLLGPQFALLRPEFYEAKRTLRKRTGKIDKVLVCMGGSDPDNVTAEVVKSLLDPRFAHLRFDVVVGPSNPHLASIERLVAGKRNFRVLTDVKNMAALMAEADFAIGGGGSMTWERAWLNLPSLAVSVAQNQEHAARQGQEVGILCVVSLGDTFEKYLFADTFFGIVHSRLHVREQIRALAELRVGRDSNVVSSLIVDGHGSRGVDLRPVALSDERVIQDLGRGSGLKNFAPTRNLNKASGQPNAGEKTSMAEGFDQFLYLASNSFGPVALLQLDLRVAGWAMELTVSRRHRGEGLEKWVLYEVIDRMINLGNFSYLSKDFHPVTASETNLGIFDLHQMPFRSTDVNSLKITLLTSEDSWLKPWIAELAVTCLLEGHLVAVVTDEDTLTEGDICFVLGYTSILTGEALKKNKNNLVVHESSLPTGRGWSPMTWQIIQGKRSIDVVIFECDDKVDSGVIYASRRIEVEVTDIIGDIRKKQASATLQLCVDFIRRYPAILQDGRRQTGNASYYRRRTQVDSEICIKESLEEQWNLIRVCDYRRYPAFFEVAGQRFLMHIDKDTAEETPDV